MARDTEELRAGVSNAASQTYANVGCMPALGGLVLVGGALAAAGVGMVTGTMAWFLLAAVLLGGGWFCVQAIGRREATTKASRARMIAQLEATAVAQWTEAIFKLRAQIEARRRASREDPDYGVRNPRPEPQPYGVSHEGAEALVAAWMRHLGEEDAAITRYSQDGGIDVASPRYVAQVKNYTGTVPVTDVREFYGVASADGRTPLFFTSGICTEGAAAFADRVGMAVFTYDAARAELHGANPAGKDLLISGL